MNSQIILHHQIKILLSSNTEFNNLTINIHGILLYAKKDNILLKALEKEIQFKPLEKTAIAIMDRKISMVLELKDGIYNSFENAIVFSIYSNNKTFVSSYISIFESLWRYIDLLEKFKEIDKRYKIQEVI